MEFHVIGRKEEMIQTPNNHGRQSRCVSAQMERQILMQNQMRERQVALQIAWSREFLRYFGAFFAVASVGLTAG